ncbi:MAG: carbohydrate-binding domain-containing protein [Oscillospiraceae bacterium]|nr:carbohydrate-binding domain-containing protein [Oscillospiraceae bacterium]
MKKNALFFVLTAAIAVAACGKDDILSSGIEGKTTYTVSDDTEDLIANTTFDYTITVTFSESGDAQVEGDANNIVTVSGNKVTADNTDYTDKVAYILKGSSSNGYFKAYSNNKQAFYLQDLTLTNPSGAPINNQGKKRCFVVLTGTNTLKDGANYTDTPDTEDEKAAFFSEGQLIFSGSGSLKVTASGKSGITSDDYLRFFDGVTVEATSSAGHALRGKDAVIVDGGTLVAKATAAMKKGVASDSLVVFKGGVTTINVSGGTDYDSDDQDYKASAGVKADQLFVMQGGELTITNSGQGGKGISCDGPAYFQGGTLTITVTGSNYGSSSSGGQGGPGGGVRPFATTSSDSSKSAKGIKCDGNIYISDGTITVKASSHEAIESKGKLEITGGTVYTQSTDDAINAAGDLAITGGYVCAYSTGNDGIDANGNCYIEGGVIYAVSAGGAEVAIDANTEGGKKLYLSGGTVFALGGLESGSSLSQSCYSGSWSSNTWYSMTVGSSTVFFKTPSSGGNGLVVSGASKPTVKSGVTVSGGSEIWNGMGNKGGSASGGSSVSLSSYSSGSGMGGGGGRP